MDLSVQIVLGVVLGVGIAAAIRAIGRRSESPPAAGELGARPPPIDGGEAAGPRRAGLGARGLATAIAAGALLLGAALRLYPEADDTPGRSPAVAPEASPAAASAEPAVDVACPRLERCCEVAGDRSVMHGICGSLPNVRGTPVGEQVCSQLLDAAPRVLAIHGTLPPECQ